MSGSLCFACGFDAEGALAAKDETPLAPPMAEEASEPILLEQQLAPELHDAIFDAGLDLESKDPFQPRSTEPQWKMASAQSPSNAGFTDDHDPFRSREAFDPFSEGSKEEPSDLPDDMGIDVDLKSGAFELKSGAFDLDNDRQEIGRSGAFEILAEAKLPEAAPKLPPPIPQEFDPFGDSTQPFANVPPQKVAEPVDFASKLSALATSLEAEGRTEDASLVREAIKRVT